ncbi:MAG: hypothetical protein GX640_11900, partial [Fibrobacter sp.]|nr:hypothetical protein [Fibrobacter sp.]
MKIDFSVPNVSLRFLPWLKRTFFVLFTCIIGNVAADGLPGEYILSDRWRTLFKYNSPLTNPALIMEQFYSSIRGTASISPDDVSNLWEAGVIVPLGFYHTAGFTVIAENGKSVENWNIQNENVTTSKNSNYLFVGSYAINPWKKLCLGININGAYQGNFGDAPSFAIGVDLGVTYRLLLHPALGFHLVGLTFQNMISPQLSLYEPMPYSSKLKAYYHARMLRNRLDLDLQFDLTDFNSPSELFSGNQKQLEWNLGIQAGLWLLPFMAIRGFTDFGDRTTIEYWGLACELNVPQLNNARDFSFVYQFRNGIKTDVGGSQSIYFKMDVGKNREEFKVRKIARMVSLGANELYNKALKLYFRDDFWGAYFVFIRLLNEFPDFFKNDIASYYAGSCVEAMDMQDEALKIYQDSKNHYPLSSITPLTDLALMRIYFRKGAYEELSSQFAELNRMNVSDSIRAHGCYIMGQAEMQ